MPLFHNNKNKSSNNSNNNNTLADDEALARELQEQFAAEFRQSRLEQQQVASIRTSRTTTASSAGANVAASTRSSAVIRGQPVVVVPPPLVVPTAPPAEGSFYSTSQQQPLRSSTNSSSWTQQRYQQADPIGRSPPPPPTSMSAVAVDPDEEYARRLQQEIEYEEAVVRRNNNNNGWKGTVTPVTASNSSSNDEYDTNVNDDDDSAVARRIEQELRDEELAMRLSAAEQERLSGYSITAHRRQMANEQNADGASSRQKCTFRRLCSFLLPLVVVVAVVVGVVWYLSNGNVNNFFPSPEDFRNEDPFNSNNFTQAEKWRTKEGNNGDNYGGLDLEIVSALDDIWIPYFDKAVSDWDNGSPDALTLTTSYSAPEYDCDPINFKIKVCNGDYGNTRWRGINKILIADADVIFASTAKMNEYYFTGSSNTDAQRQYTMCHEIGHGFGLPHSDENFDNPDLGNCMDYTNNPEVNMQPDEYNFKILEQLYGTVPGSTSTTDGSAATQTTSENIMDQSGGGRRNRVRRVRAAAAKEEAAAIPEWVLEKWRAIDREDGSGDWRLLHQSDHGEGHAVDIGGGYTIHVYKIY